MIGPTTACYRETSKNLKGLLDGVVVAMDPSIGSSSSMPGYAIYRAGKFIKKGTIAIPPGESVHYRLRKLGTEVRKLFKEFQPDVLVYEEITAMNNRRGGNQNAHASLLKALGVILSVPGPEAVGVFPISWKKLVRPEYVKGDANDAAEMGHIVIELARFISDKKKPKGKKDG